jgi:hypothetical protein
VAASFSFSNAFFVKVITLNQKHEEKCGLTRYFESLIFT